MHNDEEATHTTLTALLTDTVALAIAEHGGRIVKNTGGGFLAEFLSRFRDGAQRRPLGLPLLPF
jgi:adenylate cyclase